MSRKSLILIIAGVLLLLLCTSCGIVAFLFRDEWESFLDRGASDHIDVMNEESGADQPDLPEPSQEDPESDAEEEIDENAVITGSVGYPSEYIPETMIVCAENTLTSEEFCSDGLIEDDDFTYGIGYEITLPAGAYYVYAQVPDFDPAYKAYYDDFVVCGLDISCTSHEPILITVLPGQTASGIDPIDWYAQ